MSTISTISEFLLQAGTEYRVFDMGRGIRPIPTQQFLDIENARYQPQFPRLKHLWLGILFWNKQLSQQHYIWFLKLPVDESGFLIPASRDHFLNIVVDALGTDITQDSEQTLPDNPYSFVPPPIQLAYFNSLARHELGLPASEYLPAVQLYIAAPQQSDWRDLAMQGIADFALQLHHPRKHQLLINQFQQLDFSVQKTLLEAMENLRLQNPLTDFLTEQLAQCSPNSPSLLPLLRALQNHPNPSALKPLISELLQQGVDDEVIMVIAGRHWRLLRDPQFAQHYLLLLLEKGLLAAIYPDLVAIPCIRSVILTLAQQPEIKQALDHALTGSAS